MLTASVAWPLNAQAPPRLPDVPLVSVCIVNWNNTSLLRACLTSLLHHQQGVSLEVIVVDNASTDGAPEMVEREFPEVRLVRNAVNRGFARGNNQAAALARGDYLFFLNNDTEVPPETVQGLVAFAEEHREIGLVAPLLRDAQGRPQLSCRQAPTVRSFLSRLVMFRWAGFFRRCHRRFRGRDVDQDTTQAVEVVLGAAIFLTRQRFAEIGGWDEQFAFGGEDLDLCARVRTRGAIIFHPALEILHHGRCSTRQCGGPAFCHIRAGMVRYLRKHGTPRLTLALYKTLLTLDTPGQWLCCMGQYLWRRVRGRHRQAQRSLAVARNLGYFLRHGLAEFWAA